MTRAAAASTQAVSPVLITSPPTADGVPAERTGDLVGLVIFGSDGDSIDRRCFGQPRRRFHVRELPRSRCYRAVAGVATTTYRVRLPRRYPVTRSDPSDPVTTLEPCS